MPSNLQAYRQMADHAAMQITGSHQSWMAFLQTAARLYKYPYNEQVMIHAQRPDATACAEYDFWNEKMGRYVRRGSKGIALIDTSGDRPKLKYVFDVSDTGGRENSRRVNLWELHPEHTDSVSAMLERDYEVSGTDGLSEQLERIAAQLADEYWNANQRDKSDIIIHKAAKKAFDELGMKKLPTVKTLQAEYAKLLSEKKAAYAEYSTAQKEMRELLIHKKNIEIIFGIDEPEQARRTEKEHDRQ